MLKKDINTPLVSVIIPAYNEETYIQFCLNSLQNQTYNNLEIIVIDDGSIDNTYAIASKYNLKLIKISHGGPGNAKNFAVNVAKGDILVFLDADMYVDKNYIKNIIMPIIKKKCIGTYTIAEYVANKKNIWAKCWNINIDMPIDKRIRNIYELENSVFRSILKSKFLKFNKFNPKWGYVDDKSLKYLPYKPYPVNNAICYHFNPDTLLDVYFSARWIGRSKDFKASFKILKKYCCINSFLISIRKIIFGAPLEFLLFKLIFDIGILYGSFVKNSEQNYAK